MNIKVKDCIPKLVKKNNLNILLINYYNYNAIDFLKYYKNKNNLFIVDKFINKINNGIKVDLTHLFI